MTVAQLCDAMTMEEYMRWEAFFAERERAQKRAENRARGVIDFSDPEASGQLIAAVGGRKNG